MHNRNLEGWRSYKPLNKQILNKGSEAGAVDLGLIQKPFFSAVAAQWQERWSYDHTWDNLLCSQWGYPIFQNAVPFYLFAEIMNRKISGWAVSQKMRYLRRTEVFQENAYPETKRIWCMLWSSLNSAMSQGCWPVSMTQGNPRLRPSKVTLTERTKSW